MTRPPGFLTLVYVGRPRLLVSCGRYILMLCPRLLVSCISFIITEGCLNLVLLRAHCCERRAGVTSFKQRQNSCTYRRTSHDTPCLIFGELFRRMTTYFNEFKTHATRTDGRFNCTWYLAMFPQYIST